jgi:HSP20 family molecular chaperone IbpA
MSMLRDIGESIGTAVLDGIGRAASRLHERRPLAVDLLESDDAYLVVFDAPGAEAADVQVRFEDDAVRVRIDRFREFFEGYEMRLPGRGMSLDGRAKLPEGSSVDAESATATLTDHGTLRVELPKLESEEDRPVAIATGEENGTEVEMTDVEDVDDGAGNGAEAGGTDEE